MPAIAKTISTKGNMMPASESIRTRTDSVRGYKWDILSRFSPHGPSNAADVVTSMLHHADIPESQTETFLQPPSYESFMRETFPSIQSMRQFEEASERIADAVKRGKKIGISSDYDCDGNCSAALMYRFLIKSGVPADNIHVHIPNRSSEGYGINNAAVEAMQENHVDLILTLDNGTHATQPIQQALDNGIGVVVIDHHPDSKEQDHRIPDRPGEALVVNPTYSKTVEQPLHNDADGKIASSAHDMAAVGVTYMMACAVAEKLGADIHSGQDTQPKTGSYYDTHHITPPNMREYLGLTALATVADVVNIKKPINRYIITEGLKVINNEEDPAIAHFAKLVGRSWPIDEEDIAFNLGPIINAPGRLADSIAWQFLSGCMRKEDSPTVQYYERTLGLEDDTISSALESMITHIDSLRRSRHLVSGQRGNYASLKEDMEGYLEEIEARSGRYPGNKEILEGLDPNARRMMLTSQAVNSERQQLEAVLLSQAKKQATDILAKNPNQQVLVLHGENWHEGLVGIVAGRIKEEFGLPTVVGTVQEKDTGKWEFKCSGRSIDVEGYPVDIGEAFRQLSEKANHKHKVWKIFGAAGGHPMAAGASFHRKSKAAVENSIEALSDALNNAECIPYECGLRSLGSLAEEAREHMFTKVSGLILPEFLALKPNDIDDAELLPAFEKWNPDIPSKAREREAYLQLLKQKEPGLYQRLAFIATIKETEAMKPFGQGHRKPFFMLRNHHVSIEYTTGPGNTERHYGLSLKPVAPKRTFAPIHSGVTSNLSPTTKETSAASKMDAFAFHAIGTKLGNALHAMRNKLVGTSGSLNSMLLCSAKLDRMEKADEYGLTINPVLMIEDIADARSHMWRDPKLLTGIFSNRQPGIGLQRA